MLDPETCWNAVQLRNRALDGALVYGVHSTGIYCRPSCPSRKPRRENVRFYDNAQAAEAAGLRACQRCRPSEGPDPVLQTIRDVCAYLDGHPDMELSLGQLAAKASLSTAHFQRVFKARVGVTPKRYLDAARLRLLKRELKESSSVTEAIYSAGYGSGSRVYERIDRQMGMTPGQYRQGGRGTAISYAVQATDLGLLMMAATDRGVCFVQFGENPEHLLQQLRAEFHNASLLAAQPDSEPLALWMDELAWHIADGGPTPDLPVDLRGTAFQLKVWAFLQAIPSGEQRSYAEVAEGVGRPKSTRACANACAANRVALLVPCHRVIRGNGALGGYRWGLDRKRALIERERIAHAR